MDRSRVRILLCDHDPSSAAETLSLLRKCSYKVTAVKSARQALEVLNSSDSADVDLVLSEVELPHENGCKMLKHIMGQERLRRIPVVVMSERDEMAVVANCLRLGAVDYLVKPLRSNEVLNLWTHTWRKRRTLGLPDKHETHNCSSPVFPVNSFASDSRESNNSNTSRLVSDETDDNTCRPSTIVLQSDMTPHLELCLRLSSHYHAGSLTEQVGNSVSTKSSDLKPSSGAVVPSPDQSEQKENHASAFVSYTRTNSSSEQSAIIGSNSNLDDKLSDAEKEKELIRPRPHRVSVSSASDEVVASEERSDPLSGNFSITEKQRGVADIDRNSASLRHLQHSLQCDFASEGVSQSGQVPVLPSYQHQPYHGFFVNCASPASDVRQSGFINQPLPSPSLQFYHHESFASLPALQSATLLPSHAFPMSNPFPFYSLAPIPSPQFVPFPTWPAMAGSAPVGDCKLRQAERREAALNKFRLKRKDRCFEKKIRYASRKKLAEQRPRVRGQFVRRATTAENGNRDELYEEEEEDDEQSCSELESNSSPESTNGSSKAG